MHIARSITAIALLGSIALGAAGRVHAQDRPWRPIDGLPTGRVTLIGHDLHGRLIAEIAPGGVYVSDDEGETWTLSGRPGGHRDFMAAANGPLYARALRPELYYDVSTDGGATWSPMTMSCAAGGAMSTEPVHALLLSPPGGRWFAASETCGVFRSEDGGRTWARSGTGLEDLRVEALVRDAAGALFAGTTRGVYRSLDQAATWTAVNNGLPAYQVDHVGLTPGGAVWVTDGGLVYRSGDQGATWTRMGDFEVDLHQVHGDMLLVSAYNIGRFSARGLLRSDDEGDSWVQIGEDLGKVYTFTVLPEGTIFAAGENGVFRSADAGASWTPASRGLVEAYVEALHVTADGELLAGIGSLWRLRSEEVGWETLALRRPTLLAEAPDGAWLAGNGEACYRSTDQGATWEERLSIRPFADRGAVVDIAFDGTGTWYVVSSHIYKEKDVYALLHRSTDGGTTWTTVDLPPATTSLEGPAFYGAADGTLLLGGERTFRSVDGGQTWAAVDLGGIHVNALTAGAAGRLYAGASAREVPGGGAVAGGIFISDDRGQTWSRVLAHVDVFSLAAAAGGALLAGTGDGRLLQSNDAGTTWTARVAGLEPLRVTHLAMAADGSVYAGTNGGGIFVAEHLLATTAEAADVPGGFALFPNYPNPFAARTTLGFRLSRPAAVSVRVYDVRGRAVAILASGTYPAGTHETRWEAGEVAAGVYFCRMQVDGRTWTRALVVQR